MMIRAIHFRLLAVWMLWCSSSMAQDMIILKANELQVRCQIVSVTDSVIEYRDNDGTSHQISTQEVLSYHLNKRTSAEDVGLGTADPEEGLMGIYRMGETVAGYIISAAGDTTDGFVRVTDIFASQVKVVFVDTKGSATEYLPAQLRGYGYGDIHYESVATGYEKPLHPTYKAVSGQLFLHRIIRGPAVLYRIYRIEFNKSTVAQNPYPPLYMGHLDHDFVIRNPAGSLFFSFGKGGRGTLGAAFEHYPKFIAEMDQVKKIQKHDIPEWVGRFNGWMQLQ